MIATREGDRNYYYDKGLADGRVEGRAEGIAEGRAEGRAEYREELVRYYADRVRSRMASGMTREEAVESLSIPDFILDQVNTELDR